MPDHVHLLLALIPPRSLQDVLRLIKGRAARFISSLTSRSGSLWQRESFDHILRKNEDLLKKAEYIANNPVRAGLVERAENYPWLWIQNQAG